MCVQNPNNSDAAGEALRASELRYRRLFESAKDGILLLDAETAIITDVNPFLVNLLGIPREAFLDKKVWELGFFKDIAANEDKFAELQAHEYIRYEDLPLEAADGRAIAVEFVSNVYLVDGHRVIQCNIRDISARKRAEEARRSSQQILEGIINAIPVRVFWKNKNLVYLGCNAVFAHDAGFADPKDLIGKDDYQMAWRDQAELYRGDDRQVIESGCSKHLIEETQTTPEGNTITLLTSKIPLRSSKGEISGIVGTYMDITERKRAEKDLRESERNYREIFNNASDAIFVHDAETGAILDVNISMMQMFGTDGKTTPDLRPNDTSLGVSPYSELEVKQWLTKTLTVGPQVFEWQARRMGGEVFWAEVSLKKAVIGGQQRVLALVRDITERKNAETEKAKLETQLQQAQRMESIGGLAGGIAHDFNNILGVIIGNAEMALSQIRPDEPLYEELMEIRKAAERSASLTRQLLAFARRQPAAPKVLDLNKTVADMTNMLQRLIGENISLNWRPSGTLWPVKADPSQIDQILVNLCANARDAIVGVGKITIATEDCTLDKDYCAAHLGAIPGDYVMLSVSDDGCGIDKEKLAHIFEPFFTTKSVGKGTGLGLASVYGIVKQNQGFIDVISEPGRGTTFAIYLSRHAGLVEQAPKDGAAELVKCSHETILLVEDEPAILHIAKRALETKGYKVLAASTPSEAMRLAREKGGQISLLMTDVVLPEMSGQDLAKHLLPLYPQLKLLFMSGYTADVIAHNGVLDEGVHFIQKPFSIQDLAVKVREVLNDN